MLTTVAGVRATLRGGARVLEQVGWAQHQPVTLDGRVCAREALRIAADGDAWALADAVHAVEQLLQPLGIDLVVWNDRTDQQQSSAAALLRRAADQVAA